MGLTSQKERIAKHEVDEMNDSADNKFYMKHNCLNCKHCIDGITCDKDESDIVLFPIGQELTCCELSESAKYHEMLMNI